MVDNEIKVSFSDLVSMMKIINEKLASKSVEFDKNLEPSLERNIILRFPRITAFGMEVIIK